MPSPSIKYERLPGAANAWTGHHRLWLAPDHVLEVCTTTMNESYRRYFFADIQAITVRQTSLGRYLNVVFGVMFAGLGLVASQVPAPGFYIVLGLATPFLILLLANVILGPTCVTHIRTAVRNDRVPALSRVRATRKFLERVRPLVQQAQGSALPAEPLTPSSVAENVPATDSSA